MQRDSAPTVGASLDQANMGEDEGTGLGLGAISALCATTLFLPFLFLGRRSIDAHRQRHEIFNNTDHRQCVARMRHDARVIAEEGVDQCALARVQKWDGELAKITERPEQINALPERKFNAHQPMLCFKQQEARLEPV